MFWKKDNSEDHFWMSYTDLVTGFMIIFVIITLSLFLRDAESEILPGKYSELQETFDELFEPIPEIEVTDEATVRFLIDESKADPLFRVGKSSPTTYFRGVLDQFIPLYYQEILRLYESAQDSFEIKEIRIEGHTDSSGDYLTNLDLSSKRALGIQAYILGHPYFERSDPEFGAFIQRNTIACGYSFSRLLDSQSQLVRQSHEVEDTDKSRRVEFRILLEYKK